MMRATKTTVALSCLLVLAVSIFFGKNHGVEASAGSSEDGSEVTYGSAVKLSHVESASTDGKTEYFLHSEAKNLGSGSGQQIVTIMKGKEKTSNFWLVREEDAAEYAEETGTPVKCGATIRLTHLDTFRNLHTHDIPSALSRQQEVSAFGENGEGDRADNWQVICNKMYWLRGDKVRFRHKDTQKFLGASKDVNFNERNCGGGCPIRGHLEAFGRKGMDAFSEFKVELGVHFKK